MWHCYARMHCGCQKIRFSYATISIKLNLCMVGLTSYQALTFQAILLYVAGWIFFLPIVWLLPYSTIQDLQVVGSVTDLISVLILVLGCLLPPTWEYVRYEAHSAVLEGTSTLCNVFKASGSVNIVSLVASTKLLHDLNYLLIECYCIVVLWCWILV